MKIVLIALYRTVRDDLFSVFFAGFNLAFVVGDVLTDRIGWPFWVNALAAMILLFWLAVHFKEEMDELKGRIHNA